MKAQICFESLQYSETDRNLVIQTQAIKTMISLSKKLL